MPPPQIKKNLKRCCQCDITLHEKDTICLSMRRQYTHKSVMTRYRNYFCSYECILIHVENIIDEEKIKTKKEATKKEEKTIEQIMSEIDYGIFD